ncbi:cytochrome c oxidase subunit 7A1, mitochondrial-like [Dendronephthya gigantea]|uniref:cytochrome c oxidase subunit 7A1, mitochondrial-like n=1 Tax=Dendronephthya gigantea TaxID=151771 RepID=UPI00106B5722|nr:cytochrome c oxidase subunit 7A1, mitochondrial-like [Dendronephthya gigantea]
MFYKHNSFSGRLGSAEPFTAYQPQVLTELRPEIPRPVMASSGSTGSFSIANRTNNILKYQKLFQAGDHSIPVHLRGGSRDKMIYNIAMGISVIGIGITLGTIYAMASGKLKKAS